MNPRTVYRRRAVFALRILIGAVFVYAGQAKIQVPEAFAENIVSFRLLPSALANLVALGLPPFEMMVGVLLIVGWRRRMAAFCALLMSGIFLLALASAWIRGIPADCGCFGTGAVSVSRRSPIWLAIGRDLLLLAGTVIAYADARREDHGTQHRPAR